MSSISRDKRRTVYERDGYRCVYCGVNQKQERLTVDHVIPRSRGGSNTIRNLVTCCYPCNDHKGNTILADTSNLPVTGEYASTKPKVNLKDHPNYQPPTADDLWPGIWYRQTNLSKAQTHILKQAIATYNYQFSRRPGTKYGTAG